MTAARPIDLDYSDPDFIADPYPTLAGLRDRGPMLWDERANLWIATTHAAVSAVLRNRSLGRLWTDHDPTEQMGTFNALHRNQMMENEPPTHTRLRRLVAGAFGRGHVERMRPRIDGLAAQMAAELEDHCDILAQYAEPMPVYVIADMLGVPRKDHHDLRRWSQAMVQMYEPQVTEQTRDRAAEASVAFDEYIRDLVRFRRGNLDDDLISDLLTEVDGGTSLSEDELVASVVLLLNAGHEASVNAFGNGLYALLTHQDQYDRVITGEVDIATVLEELIRFDAPLQMFVRTATETAHIAGATIEPGQRVATLMGSANRDPETFAAPDELDVSRDPNPHVGFGMGAHFCLGAPLARIELQSSLGALFDRFDRLQLAAEPRRRPTWVLRGFESLEVTT